MQHLVSSLTGKLRSRLQHITLKTCKTICVVIQAINAQQTNKLVYGLVKNTNFLRQKTEEHRGIRFVHGYTPTIIQIINRRRTDVKRSVPCQEIQELLHGTSHNHVNTVTRDTDLGGNSKALQLIFRLWCGPNAISCVGILHTRTQSRTHKT